MTRNGFASIAIIAIAVLAIGGFVGYSVFQKSPERQVACTADARMCPDGSYVGRVGPNCEFKSCPELRAPKGEFAKPQAASYPSREELRAEMEMGLKSGGISPTRFASMKREVDAFFARGIDVTDLRILLGKFVVGGTEAPKPPVQAPTAQPKETARVETKPFWEYNPSKPELGWYWAREGKPPACTEPIVMESPIDVNFVTAILYPGQIRGDGPKDFKPHGGFTLKPNSPIEIKAPMDGYLVSVAKFTDVFGYHVGLTFQHPCGIQFGGGHWGALPPDIQAVVDKVPIKGFGESRTEPIIPPYFIKKGQVIVTGLQEKAHPERPGFDWGVADYRQRNAASNDPQFRELYGYAPWNTYYGVCWLDLLPPDQRAVLKGLPGGDGKQGKNSAYCK